MSIKGKIRDKLLDSKNGSLFFYQFRRIREKVALWLYSDHEYVVNTYYKRFKEKINLIEPSTIQEKLQWLKLFYRDDNIPVCSDKYELHQYLEKQDLGYLGNEVLGIYNKVDDINFSLLPNKFVIKATHGSGWNIICKNKDELDWKYTKKVMNLWLKLNLFVFGREWNYKNIRPRILIEKYLDFQPLNDYKFMCYNGEPLYMQLNNDYNGIHYVDFYDLKTWEHLPVTYGPYNVSDRIISKPAQFDEMMVLARKLSKPFPFVRVDFYNFNNTIILGEMTFFPGGGLWPFTPFDIGKKYNLLLGEPLVLPKANYNQELQDKLLKENK